MNSKVREKELAIALRRKGLTYREILERVPVAKSSISLWLKDFPLTTKEKEILKKRKNTDMTRWRAMAGAALSQRRVERDKALFLVAREEFQTAIREPLFQVGIALYWAEGAKRASTFSFINSDVDMTILMLDWVRKYLVLADENQIRMRVFTHKAFEHEHH